MRYVLLKYFEYFSKIRTDNSGSFGQSARQRYRPLWWAHSSHLPVQSDDKQPIKQTSMSPKPARSLTFKCTACSKPVTVYLQKVSACSHIQPYLGLCACGTPYRHATGQADAVNSFKFSLDGGWRHHH